jgi:tetratricopeptide (TPR) repeat protein
MFMLETLKHLIEKGTLEQDFPEHLPPPGRIGALVRQRLELLSAAALRLVRVAAIAGTDFSLELGAKVLETNWVDLTEPLVELEQAQVMKAEKFSHDLIFEAVQDGIPHGTKILVHSRIAAFLEHQGSNPSRVARHWLEALEYDRAAPVMIVAAEIAQDMGRDEEAIELLERTIALPVAVEHRHRAQALLGGIHVHAQRYDDAQYDLESLLEVVNDPKAHWLTLDHLCYLHLSKGSLERAQHFGLRALELAKLHGVLSQLEDTQYKLGAIAFGVGEYERALELITPVIKSWREQPVGIRYLNALGAFAQSLQHLGRDTQASLYIDEMLRHANAIGADAVIVNHTSNALYDAFVRGDATSAIHDAENLLRNLEQQASGVKVDMLRNNLAAIYTRLERPDDAIRQYRLLTGNESESVEYRCRAWANLAVLYHQQSNPEFSKRALNRALELAPDDDFPSTRFAVIRAAYTLGTSQQRATVQPYMDALNLDALPVSYRNELEELLAARKHSLDTNTT